MSKVFLIVERETGRLDTLTTDVETARWWMSDGFRKKHFNVVEIEGRAWEDEEADRG